MHLLHHQCECFDVFIAGYDSPGKWLQGCLTLQSVANACWGAPVTFLCFWYLAYNFEETHQKDGRGIKGNPAAILSPVTPCSVVRTSFACACPTLASDAELSLQELSGHSRMSQAHISRMNRKKCGSSVDDFLALLQSLPVQGPYNVSSGPFPHD